MNNLPAFVRYGAVVLATSMIFVLGLVFAKYRSTPTPPKQNLFDNTSAGFQRFSQEYMKNICSSWDGKVRRGDYYDSASSAFTFNVDKTDSLTTPYVATLSFKRTTKDVADPAYSYLIEGDETVRFGWQNDKWVLKSAGEEGYRVFSYAKAKIPG